MGRGRGASERLQASGSHRLAHVGDSVGVVVPKVWRVSACPDLGRFGTVPDTDDPTAQQPQARPSISTAVRPLSAVSAGRWLWPGKAA